MKITEGDNYTDITTLDTTTVTVMHNTGEGVELFILHDALVVSTYLTAREVDALCSALQRAKEAK